jgi:hypothetical protein
MRFLVGIGLAALMALAGPPTAASAATVPFTEDFATGDAGWRGNPNSVGSLDWSSAGYVSEVFNFAASTAGGQGPVLFRGPVSASGGNFAGDWLTDGVSEIAFSVRHDAEVPITFFARFAAPMGFPGAIAVAFAPVASSADWTQLVFAIDPSNPQFIGFEGSDFTTVFSSIGTVQLGVVVPEALAGVDADVQFDLTSAATVPEPAGLAALALAALAAFFAFRAPSGAQTGRGVRS